MKNKGAQVSIAAVCVILGMMLAIQFKTNEVYEENFIPDRVEELTRKLNAVTEERDILTEEVLSLKEKLENVRENDQAMADLQEDIRKANMAAGLIAVKGPGVEIVLNDSVRILQNGEDPNTALIHEQDILTVVNELRASGAEAISINNERITAVSEIRCAGTMILVNTNRIGPPFIIKAIGDPDMLESGMLIPGGYLEALKFVGAQATIQKVEEIEIPALSRPLKFTHGTPIQYKEKEKA